MGASPEDRKMPETGTAEPVVYRPAIASRTCGRVATCITLLFFLSVFAPRLAGTWRSHPHVLVCLCVCLVVATFLAITFGWLSLWRIERSRGALFGEYEANAGLRLGYLCVFPSLVVIPMFLGSLLHDPPTRRSCQNNLKQLGVIFKMFSNEDAKGMFPDLSPEAGKLAISNRDKFVYPEYLTDPTVLFCQDSAEKNICKPGDKVSDAQPLFDQSSYMYLGYAVGDERGLQAFAAAYKDRIAKGLSFNEDLPVPPDAATATGYSTIHRLGKDAERYLITDINNPAATAQAQARIPVLIERLGHHKSEGGNILFLDGHVEFMKYPGKWPMTEKAMEILQSIEAMRKGSP